MKTLMPLDEARKTVRDCVCSGCYGQLIAQYDKTQKAFTVGCDTPDCPSDGFVSRKWVERQEDQSRLDLIDAKLALRAAAPWVAPKKSDEQILKDLGF